jgi:hypothetical protein
MPVIRSALKGARGNAASASRPARKKERSKGSAREPAKSQEKSGAQKKGEPKKAEASLLTLPGVVAAPLFPATFAPQSKGETALATSEILEAPDASEKDGGFLTLTDEEGEFLRLADEAAKSDFDEQQGRRRALVPGQLSAKETFSKRFNDRFHLDALEKNIQLHQPPSDEQTAHIRQADFLLRKLDNLTNREILQGSNEAKASLKSAAQGGSLEQWEQQIDRLLFLTHRSHFLGGPQERLQHIIQAFVDDEVRDVLTSPRAREAGADSLLEWMLRNLIRP